MSFLVAAGLSVAFQTTPAELGYNLVHLGGCEVAGWTLDHDAADLHLSQQLVASGLAQADFEAAIVEGANAAAAEFRAETTSTTTQAQARASLATIRERCDALTVAYPEIIRRSAETEAAWDAYMQRVIARYPE